MEATAGYDDVGDEDSAELTTTVCHHEGAASGATGDVTGTHVDEGPGRRKEEFIGLGQRDSTAHGVDGGKGLMVEATVHHAWRDDVGGELEGADTRSPHRARSVVLRGQRWARFPP